MHQGEKVDRHTNIETIAASEGSAKGDGTKIIRDVYTVYSDFSLAALRQGVDSRIDGQC
jgi:hypothetical protein